MGQKINFTITGLRFGAERLRAVRVLLTLVMAVGGLASGAFVPGTLAAPGTATDKSVSDNVRSPAGQNSFKVAQNWLFGDKPKPQRRRAPVRRQNNEYAPQRDQNYDRQYRDGGGAYGTMEAQQRPLTMRERKCQKLERALAADWVQGRKPNYKLPALQDKIRKFDQLYNKTRAQADRRKCYSNFLIFGDQLRNTRKCRRLDRQIKKLERQLSRLQRQRKSMTRVRHDSSRRSSIIDNLARYRCGRQYQREAKKNSFFGWVAPETYNRPTYGNHSGEVSPFATYRTMCVRLCDGYYFPVNFSTLPSQFPQDDIVCAQQCAAPAQLFIYRNPGEEVEQMTSWDGSTAYREIKNAFRYRTETVPGCSCKSGEYLVENQNSPNGNAATPQTTGALQEQSRSASPKNSASAPKRARRKTAKAVP